MTAVLRSSTFQEMEKSSIYSGLFGKASIR